MNVLRSMVGAVEAWLWRRGITHPAVRVLLRNEILCVAVVMLGGVIARHDWLCWCALGMGMVAWTFWGVARFFLKEGIPAYSRILLYKVLVRWFCRLAVMACLLYVALVILAAPVFAIAGGMVAGSVLALASYGLHVLHRHRPGAENRI